MTTRITIVEEVAANELVIECRLCDGSGNKPGYKSHVACDVCKGKGLVLVEAEPPLVECRLCDGSGNKPGYKSHVPCDACEGTGAQPLSGEMNVQT